MDLVGYSNLCNTGLKYFIASAETIMGDKNFILIIIIIITDSKIKFILIL